MSLVQGRLDKLQTGLVRDLLIFPPPQPSRTGPGSPSSRRVPTDTVHESVACQRLLSLFFLPAGSKKY